jgi:hypothetical protein
MLLGIGGAPPHRSPDTTRAPGKVLPGLFGGVASAQAQATETAGREPGVVVRCAALYAIAFEGT